MIIGLTGKNGSGKTAVSEYLKSRGFEYYSLSDEIREEMRSRGLEITRDVLIEIGNELRRQFGPGVLAERILSKLGNERNYVVDSIRNPQEVDGLEAPQGFYAAGPGSGPGDSLRAQPRAGEGERGRRLSINLPPKRRANSSRAIRPASSLNATRREADLVVDNNGMLDGLHRQLDSMLPPLMSGLRRARPGTNTS